MHSGSCSTKHRMMSLWEWSIMFKISTFPFPWIRNAYLKASRTMTSSSSMKFSNGVHNIVEIEAGSFSCAICIMNCFKLFMNNNLTSLGESCFSNWKSGFIKEKSEIVLLSWSEKDEKGRNIGNIEKNMIVQVKSFLNSQFKELLHLTDNDQNSSTNSNSRNTTF